MTDQELTQQMVDKMDEWAQRIAQNVFEKESQHVPPAVACLAAVYFIREQIKKSDVVTPAAIVKILQNKLEEQEYDGFNSLSSVGSN
jgi:hypothetical protein